MTEYFLLLSVCCLHSSNDVSILCNEGRNGALTREVYRRIGGLEKTIPCFGI